MSNESSEQELKEYIENKYQKTNEKTKIKFYIPDHYMPVVDLIPTMNEEGVLTVKSILQISKFWL